MVGLLRVKTLHETEKVEGGSCQEIHEKTIHEEPPLTQPTIEETNVGWIKDNLGTLPLAPQDNQEKSADNIVPPSSKILKWLLNKKSLKRKLLILQLLPLLMLQLLG